jgi:calcineurin-like phosphoesterase family protein
MPTENLSASPKLCFDRTPNIWIISDIQPVSLEQAELVLRSAVDDILELDLRPDSVWILGDAYRGKDQDLIERIVDLYVEQTNRLGVPICYLLGNHEMDLSSALDTNIFPLYERGKLEGWQVQGDLGEYFFSRVFGETLVVFLGDHAEAERQWWTTHGHVREARAASYPYSEKQYRNLARLMGEYEGPVIIAAHYALPGGQKPSGLLAQLRPLPPNVKLVLHGHAHIGDLVWNKADCWERLHPVEGQPGLRQINVSALEIERSPGSHSAWLRLDENGPAELRIRCHQARQWLETYNF